MRVGLLTKEFPPEIYGGAGVHVNFLVRELRSTVDLERAVHCFGAPRPDATAHQVPDSLRAANPAVQTLGVDLSMVAAVAGYDVLHSHTWYANLAGHLGSLLYGVPHVLTAHSLEPRRPWKAEQLGGGYALSSWAERTAYEGAAAVIAVSDGMRRDVLACYPALDPARVHVVRNGIDTAAYFPDPETDVLDRLGIDRPYVLFVGRITRQKGLAHLVRAAARVDPGARIVLCAGAPDTAELGAEIEGLVQDLHVSRGGIVWIREMLPREQLRQLLGHAAVFCCPSVYEPLGIVNLEAMACGTAVVASDVGGIPEVVEDGVTGRLVRYDGQHPAGFETELADALNAVLADPAGCAAMGRAGRERAVAEFGWDAVAERTVEVYRAVLP
ncbi:glycogen synthase [soil metagenome]